MNQQEERAFKVIFSSNDRIRSITRKWRLFWEFIKKNGEIVWRSQLLFIPLHMEKLQFLLHTRVLNQC